MKNVFASTSKIIKIAFIVGLNLQAGSTMDPPQVDDPQKKIIEEMKGALLLSPFNASSFSCQKPKSMGVFQIPSEKLWIDDNVDDNLVYFSGAWLASRIPLKSILPGPKNNSIVFKDPPFVQVNPIQNATPIPQRLGDPRYVQVLTLANFDEYIPPKLKRLGYNYFDHFVSIQYLLDAQDEQSITDILCKDLTSRGFVKSDVENSIDDYCDIEEYKIDRNKYSILRYWKPYKSYLFVTEDVNKIAEFLSVFSNRNLIPGSVIPKIMKYARMEEVKIKPVPLPYTHVNIESRMPSMILQIKAQDGCFYEQEPFPAEDDPYQSKPIMLSQDILKHILNDGNRGIEPCPCEGGLLDIIEKHPNNRMQKMRDFIIDYNFRLGSGDKGNVWLAQHVPSKIFVAVKTVSSYIEPPKYPDVVSLEQLKRLYGLFKAHNHENIEQIFIFMPLANGIPSISLRNSEAFPVKTTVKDGTLNIKNLEVSLNLISCFIKEVEYFSKSGYFQVDAQAVHVYVCNNFQSVCIIDYDGEQRAHSIPETEWCIAPYRFSIINFLGIHEYGVFKSSTLLPPDKVSQLKQPKHIIDFLKAVDNNKVGPYSLAQLKLDFNALRSGESVI